jgi:hypothetical protein
MPVSGSSGKRTREYEKLKGEFEKSGRYKGREKEVAARIVNKQRSQYGETKEEKKKDRQGRSPDRNLPIKDYQQLTADQVKNKLNSASESQLKKIRDYESSHKNRKTVLQAIDKRMG